MFSFEKKNQKTFCTSSLWPGNVPDRQASSAAKRLWPREASV
jgi:hypothetical protein